MFKKFVQKKVRARVSFPRENDDNDEFQGVTNGVF